MKDIRIDSETRALLQIDRALEYFAGFAYSGLGAEAVCGRAAQRGAPAEHEESERPVREVWALLGDGLEPPLAGLFDPRDLIDTLRPDAARLDPRDFLRLARFIDLAAPAIRFGATHADETPWIAGQCAALEPLGDLSRAIRAIIDDDGLVRDRASSRLSKIRSELRGITGQMQKAIQRLLRRHGSAGDLSDSFFTMRDDRYCLPVAAGRRKSVAGITHGASGSAETVYIEPIELVELSNHARELTEQEAEEVRRLLTELGATIRPHLPTLDRHVAIFTRLDDAAARGRGGWDRGLKLARLVEQPAVNWSVDGDDTEFRRAAVPQNAPTAKGGRRAEPGATGALAIQSGHHLLLFLGLGEAKQSVAVDLELRAGDRVLLLSGPNAGGKTTLLKTVGLLCWLAQAGFPVPLGADSTLPIVGHIGALIGDQQDTLAGDSTFSAHLKRLHQLLEDARPDSLLLLDEIASGTDPTEGAPLAMAALEWLAWRGGLVLASSHLGPLKEWANDFPPARNGSFALDDENHRPTFHLMLDVPGASEALLVAESVGVPRAVLERARALIPEEIAPAQALMTSLALKSRAVAEEAAAQAKLAEEQSARAAELDRREADLREDKQTFRERMLREKLRDLREVREEIERRVAALPPREGLKEARPLAETAIDATGERLQEIEREQGERRREESSGGAAEIVAEGRRVFVGPLRTWAEVLRVDEERGRVRLDIEGTELEMSLARLRGKGLPALAESELAPFDLGRALSGEVGEVTEKPPSPPPSPKTPPPPADILSGVKRVEGRGLFRAKNKGAAPDEGSNPAPEPKPGEAPKPKSAKRRTSKKKGFSDEDFFASPLEKVRKKARGGAKAASKSPSKKANKPQPPEEPQGGFVIRRAEGAAAPQLTLDLHGMRVDEALPVVDQYLNDALLSNYPYVRLMHGIGTGTLRRAIHDHLRGHPSIKRLTLAPSGDGGDGVTVVEFE